MTGSVCCDEDWKPSARRHNCLRSQSIANKSDLRYGGGRDDTTNNFSVVIIIPGSSARHFDTDQQMAGPADHTPHIIIKIATAARTGPVI